MPLRLPLACCTVALLLGAAPAGAVAPAPGERIAAAVSAGGVDVSGLTVEEATQRLEGQRARLEAGSVTVQAADLLFKLKTKDADASFDVTRSVKRALYAGRAAAGAAVDVPLAVTYKQRAVRGFTARIDKRVSRAPRDSQLVITLRSVRVTHSRTGRDIDSRALAKRIGKALVDPRTDRVFKVKLRKVKPRVNALARRREGRTVITIDQSAFKLRLFKDLKVRKTYGVAVGQSAYPTPNGRFAIQNKQVNPVWSVPNSPWAGELAGSTVAGGSGANPLKARWMAIVNGVGIHGTGEGGSIGTRASHGCIRMHVPDVIDLFPRVPVGTPVLIGR